MQRGGDVADRAPELESLGLVGGKLQKLPQNDFSLADGFDGIDQAHDRNFAIRPGLVDVGTRAGLVSVEAFVDPQNLVQPLDARFQVTHRFTRDQHIHISDIEILDRQPHLVLILRLHHLECARRISHAIPTLVSIVNRMRYVDIILCRAVWPPHRIRAVRNKLAVGVEERVGPQTGRQDVGACLGDFELFGPQVEVLVHEKLDRLIDREAVGRSLFLVMSGSSSEP